MAMVRFSKEAGCWVFDCIFGCSGIDYEGEAEANEALFLHDCIVSEVCS